MASRAVINVSEPIKQLQLSSPPIPYTLFSKSDKLVIKILLSLSMLASPLTATIYMPVIPLLARHFHTTTQAINLTITVYLVFQALSPAIFATISDVQGRRTVFLTTYGIYVLASVGLAISTDSYPALLILRAFQSLGASAIIPVAYGVIADVCVPSERGMMLGPIMVATNLGVCVGPVLGGLLTLAPDGSQWVFRFLLIFGGVTFLAIAFFFPETARAVVGNGSIKATGWRRTWSNLLKAPIARKKDVVTTNTITGNPTELKESHVTEPVEKAKKEWDWKALNPFACLRILFWRDAALALWMTASFYAVFMCIQTSISTIFQDTYGFGDVISGLCYLPGGFGIVLAGPLNGCLMDYNYRRTARSIGHEIDRVAGDDLASFPIERARARSSFHLLAIYVAMQVGYGWAVRFHIHVSLPLILQFALGFVFTCFNQTYSTLLVDIFPQSPSTASAAGAIMRCGLSALAVAVMQPLINVMGYGWYFTLLTVICGVGGFGAIWLIRSKGMRWRTQRLNKSRSRESEREPVLSIAAQNSRREKRKEETVVIA